MGTQRLSNVGIRVKLYASSNEYIEYPATGILYIHEITTTGEVSNATFEQHLPAAEGPSVRVMWPKFVSPEAGLPAQYKMIDGTVFAAYNEAQLVEQLRRNHFDSHMLKTAADYMENFVKTAAWFSKAHIRTDSVENFVNDAIKAGFITEVAN